MTARSLSLSMAFVSAGVGLGALPGVARATERGTPAPSFTQDAEQPLAALQDVDVIEHLGDKVPSGLTFQDPEGHKVELDAMLGGKPLLVTLGYYR